MKFSASLLVCVLTTSAWADDERWQNWFVGVNNSGGSHPVTVETEAEASAVYAGVSSADGNGDRIRLGVRCHLGGPRGDDAASDKGVITAVFIGGMLRDVEVPIDLFGSFDGGQPVEMGLFLFNQGALVGNAKPQFLAMLMSHNELKITSDNGTFFAKVSLEDASEAISEIRCWGDL